MKTTKSKVKNSFDPQAYLDTAGVARKVTAFRRAETIFSQGDAAESVMYVQKGGVKLSVVNGSGKEAVVAMFRTGDFLEKAAWLGRAFAWERRRRLLTPRF